MDVVEAAEELREDMVVATSQLRASFEPGDQRRAFRLALATLYTWRNMVRPDGVLYSDVAGGEVLEHLIELRGLYEHQLLAAQGQSALQNADLLVGEDVVPSEERYLWDVVIRTDIDTSSWAARKRAAYDALSGKIAPDLLENATSFLVRQVR